MQNFFDLDLEGHQIIVDNGGDPFPWKSRSDFCICTDGSLAGGYGHL